MFKIFEEWRVGQEPHGDDLLGLVVYLIDPHDAVIWLNKDRKIERILDSAHDRGWQFKIILTTEINGIELVSDGFNESVYYNLKNFGIMPSETIKDEREPRIRWYNDGKLDESVHQIITDHPLIGLKAVLRYHIKALFTIDHRDGSIIENLNSGNGIGWGFIIKKVINIDGKTLISSTKRTDDSMYYNSENFIIEGENIPPPRIRWYNNGKLEETVSTDLSHLIGLKAVLIEPENALFELNYKEDKIISYKNSVNKKLWDFIIKNVKKIDGIILISNGHAYYDANNFQIDGYQGYKPLIKWYSD